MNVISSTGRRINRHPQRRSAATHLTRLTLLLVSIALWSSAVWTQPRVSYANPQASTCVTLKPAKNAGFDSYIKSNSATNNYGGDSRIEVKTKVTSGGQIDELKRGVIRFDLSSIPVNSIIDSASLKLAVDTAPSAGDGGLNISVHRLTTAWNESTVTWNSPWSTPGGNFIATAITTQNIDSNDKFSSLGDQPVSFDVTSGVAFFMQNPTSNYGFLLKGPDTLTGKLDREVKFWSNDESNADKQPALEVCYSPGIVLAPSNAAQAAPGDTLVYPHTLTIGDLPGTANETIALAISSSAGLPSTAYVDNGTVGVYEPGTDTQITGPVSLPQNSTTNVLIVTQVPANTPDGTIDQTTITATGSPSGIVASAVNTTSVGVPPFTEPVVDGKLDTAYLTNPDTVIQEYCADPSTGLSGQVLARTFATYDLNNAQSNNVYIVLEMDLAMVDNTYGDSPSLHPSWTAAGKSHSLSSLVGSDEAEFSLFGANGSLVASPIVDYSGGATSGYHPDYIDNVTTQQAAQIVAKTSLGYNFTTLGYSNTSNSPALTATQPTDPYIPVDSQFSNWQFVYLYELSIDKAFFTSAGGFGRVSIPYTHVSPNKLGDNVIDAVPCDGSIGDRVWYDRNQDGMQDAGEPGLNGVRVELFADNGDGVFNATTDYPRGSHITSGDGDYLFTGLGPGTFWVNVVDTTVPAGFFITTNNDPFGPINLAADQDFLNADFGYTTNPEIAISKWQVSEDPTVVGGTIDYTIAITNTGQTAIAVLPLQDFFDESRLMYDTMLAGPVPDSVVGGIINWSNVLIAPDTLLPGESVSVTVRFKALSITAGASTRDAQVPDATLRTVADFPTFDAEMLGRAPSATIGGINLGDLTDYLFFFANGSQDANWQGASKGFVGDVAVDGIQAAERTSGGVPYAGTIYTNDSTLGAWQNIVNQNAGQASAVTGEVARVSSLETDLASAFTQINALPATAGYTSVASSALNGLNTQNGIAETFVVNITSGLSFNSKINITGDAGDVFILRWDTDGNPANGYQGQVKPSGGGAIVPLGGLKATNFINVAGDLNASGGGSNPASPYPQGPRLNDGTGALISGAQDFSGGGFFTGYWLTTGDPTSGDTAPFSNAIFVGGWYTTSDKFSMTSGTSGVYVSPPGNTTPPPPPTGSGSCTAPFNNNVYVNTDDCKCEKPTQMTVRYTGTGPTTITIGGNGSGGPFTNVNTGDTFTISVTGNEPTFTAGAGGSGGTQAIHTSCSSPLYPGWSSRPAGQDKFTQGGPYEVVSFNTNGTPFVMANPASCTLGSIGDRVIVGTTVPDNGSEPGVSGVTVNLYGGSCPADPADLTPASRLKTTTTNANGVYDFTGLIPGEYCVAVDNGTLPVIYTLGTDSPLDAASQGNDVNTCDFGVELVGTGSIGDRVFYDLNGDGLPDDDANEPGLNGVTVNLSLNGQPFGSTTTSVNGNYLFTNLPAGTYTVDVVNSSVPAGLSLTTGNDPQTVVLADGQNFRDADFGYIGDCNTAFIGGAKDVNGSDIPSVADGAACAIIAPATIGNYVWIDEDSDGYQDAGEPGLANVTVELFEGNTLVATEITDSNGGYLFTGLRPGTYTVQVDAGTLPAGATQTTNPVLPGADFGNQSQPYSVTVTAGQENLTADFGYNWGDPTNPPQGAKGAIGDRVWVDTDGDGFQDAGEPGLGNIPVTIYWDSNGDGQVQPGVDQPFTGAVDQNGNTGTGTTTTNPDGFYIFSQLPPGSYVIVVNNGTTPAGYTQTGDPDDYGVPATNPDNRTTSPIVLAPGDVFLLADFGYRPPVNGSNNNTIGDRVWLDSDADGVQDANEPGINGVTVALLDVNDVVIATDTTDASGLYLFTGLPDGTYTVMVTDSNNVLGTLQQTGDPDATLDGMSTVTNLGVGNPNPVSNLNQDFGYTPNGNQPGDGVIGDTIFLNINGNATQDAGEPGIEGVVVELFSDINGDGAVNGGDTLLATAITNENGNYFFGGIDPNGQYTVRVAASNFAANGALEGLANTADPDGGNNSRSGVNLGAPGTDGNADPDGLDNGINLGQDFGYTVSNGTLVRQIGNLIWKDTNANGIYEPANGETPIGGVTVDLYRDLNGDGLVNPGEPLYGSTTSSATINAGSFGTNGNYIFNGLPADRYVVDVTDVNGVLGGYWQSLGAQAQTTDNTSKVDPFAVDVTSASRLTADFGYYVDLASVGDFIFEDVNNNGLQDGGEPGIPGVVVTLTITYPNGDVTVLTTVSDANGAYSFDGLLGDEDFNGIGTPATPGVGGGDEPAFIVTAEVPANAIPAPINVGANDAIDSDDPINGEQANPVQGSADNTNDFGFVQEATAAIGNYVWIDENSDGYQDAGEPGLPNVTVELRDGNGALLATTQTDTNGGYLFANLIPGTYRVQVDATTLPAGATQTTNPVLPGADFGNQSQPYSVTLAPGQENLTADFGYNWGNPNNPPQGATGAIGDRVWVDEDGDGKQDDGEPGLGNIPVTIYWDSNGDGVVDPNVDQPFTGAVDQNGNTGTGTTTTEPDGSYIFSNLPAGQYVVVVNNGTTPTGYTQTGDPDDFGQPATNPDNQTTTPIVLAPGDVYLNADFGYQPPANGGNNNSLGDLVWLDQDADGVRDPLESGIAGVTLALLDSNGNIIATTTTNAAGFYEFVGLPDGIYTVRVTDTNAVLTALEQTGDPDATLDGAGTTDLDSFGLNPAPVNDPTLDFGYTPRNHQPGRGLIGDTVFIDRNANNVYNPGEEVEGVVVELRDNSNNLIATTTTDENGNYYFGDLNPTATYRVTIAASNFAAGGVLQGTLNTVDPDNAPGSGDNTSLVNLGAPGNDGNADPDGTDNGVNLGQDFGYRPGVGQSGIIGNLIWNDTNANGVYEAGLGETPIGGVTVDIYRDLNGNGVVDAGDPKVGSTTSAAAISAQFGADGNYLFSNLPFGNYVVDVTDNAGVLAGFWQSLGAANTNNNSQVDPDAAAISAGGTSNLRSDFGYYVEPASVGDFVFDDLDGDGIQDVGEPGLPGVVVTLTITYPNGDVTVLTTVSDANGAYSFDNLLSDEDYNGIGTPATPGVGGGDEPAHVVTAQVPTGYVPTDINVGGNDAIDSDDPLNGELASPVQGGSDDTNDFGFDVLYTLGNQVWADQNGGTQGIKDANEPGIPGVTVQLYRDSDGTPGVSLGDTFIGTRTTDGNGFYSFSGLQPGNYYVVIPSSNLEPGGALATFNGPTTFAANPNNNVDNDNNGQIQQIGVSIAVVSNPITLGGRAEPSGNGTINNTLDFGFVQGGQTAVTLSALNTSAATRNVALLPLLVALLGMATLPLVTRRRTL